MVTRLLLFQVDYSPSVLQFAYIALIDCRIVAVPLGSVTAHQKDIASNLLCLVVHQIDSGNRLQFRFGQVDVFNFGGKQIGRKIIVDAPYALSLIDSKKGGRR